jgi:hypothetical protein
MFLALVDQPTSRCRWPVSGAGSSWTSAWEDFSWGLKPVRNVATAAGWRFTANGAPGTKLRERAARRGTARGENGGPPFIYAPTRPSLDERKLRELVSHRDQREFICDYSSGKNESFEKDGKVADFCLTRLATRI